MNMGWQIAEKVAIYQPIIYCVYKLVYYYFVQSICRALLYPISCTSTLDYSSQHLRSTLP